MSPCRPLLHRLRGSAFRSAAAITVITVTAAIIVVMAIAAAAPITRRAITITVRATMAAAPGLSSAKHAATIDSSSLAKAGLFLFVLSDRDQVGAGSMADPGYGEIAEQLGFAATARDGVEDEAGEQ